MKADFQLDGAQLGEANFITIDTHAGSVLLSVFRFQEGLGDVARFHQRRGNMDVWLGEVPPNKPSNDTQVRRLATFRMNRSEARSISALLMEAARELAKAGSR